MSYPIDLDEQTDQAIFAEYDRRVRLANRGCCTYCGLDRIVCNCKMHARRGQVKKLLRPIDPARREVEFERPA